MGYTIKVWDDNKAANKIDDSTRIFISRKKCGPMELKTRVSMAICHKSIINRKYINKIYSIIRAALAGFPYF